MKSLKKKKIINLIRKKASQSSCKYKISAIALNKKSEIIAQAINKHGQNENDYYRGLHAEMECLKKCKSTPTAMIIGRVNPAGDMLPIHPCNTCRKILEKKGIKIMTVSSDEDIERT